MPMDLTSYLSSMKVRYGIMGAFSTRWVCDTKVPWVRITENVLVYETRDGRIERKTLKYLQGIEIIDETKD